MRFYLGTHRPHWLRQFDVPLFVSHRQLRRYRVLPVALGGWALDSGGFTELSTPPHRWVTTVPEYVEAVQRYQADVGRLDWAAPMDWMCEPHIIARTGLSVREHQERTVSNYLELRGQGMRFVLCETCGGSGTVECGSIHPGWCENEPCHGHCEVACPDCTGEGMVEASVFIPVLQGWTLGDYEACLALYADAGVDLTAEPVVGLGSVCRRQSTAEIGVIVRLLHEEGIRAHGFGVKKLGLARYGHLLASADSMAWSFDARRAKPLPGCTHGVCNNCPRWALRWRDAALADFEAQATARERQTVLM